MLTPKQTVRLLELCEQVLAIKASLPVPPPSVSVESFAAALDMDTLADTFAELAALLHDAI